MCDNNTNVITLRISDLQKIVDWYYSFQGTSSLVLSQDVTIKVGTNGIGPTVNVYVDTGNCEGVYKDFTDYSSW